jgi:hypothetical protein
VVVAKEFDGAGAVDEPRTAIVLCIIVGRAKPSLVHHHLVPPIQRQAAMHKVYEEDVGPNVRPHCRTRAKAIRCIQRVGFASNDRGSSRGRILVALIDKPPYATRPPSMVRSSNPTFSLQDFCFGSAFLHSSTDPPISIR